MTNESLWHRIRLLAAVAWAGLTSLVGIGTDLVEPGPELHTTVTFRAVVDAVLPETPALDDELGPEHVPGGLAVGLEEFVVTYIDDGFQFGLPYLGAQGNLPLAGPVAELLDTAAVALVARGDNESEPSADRAASLLDPGEADPEAVAEAAGTFSKLAPADRLRAVAILDEFEFEVSPDDDSLFEADAGLVGQLVVGFAELIYYSEWEGYDEFAQPPGERVHPNDPEAVGSWRQTGYPGFADGYAALRGYVGTDDGPLGGGETRTTIDDAGGVRVVRESGTFRENDYDTGDYEEPYLVEEVA